MRSLIISILYLGEEKQLVFRDKSALLSTRGRLDEGAVVSAGHRDTGLSVAPRSGEGGMRCEVRGQLPGPSQPLTDPVSMTSG